MSDEMNEDPISPSIQELVLVFKNDLASVSFPDVSLETLETLSQNVRKASAELADALAKADAAQQALEEGQSQLQTKAVRGLAYAKVFAEGNDELLDKLSQINLGKAGRSVKKASVEKPKAEKTADSAEESQKSEEKKAAKAAKKSSAQATEEA